MRKFSSTIINYLGEILPSDSWDRFQISSSNEGLSCKQCGNVDQLDISILQTRVHAHYFLQGGKSPQRWQVWSKGDFVFKTPAYDHLVLVCFQAEMRSEFRCCSAAPFEKGYQADGCPDGMMDGLESIAYVLIRCLYPNISTWEHHRILKHPENIKLN